MRRKTHVGNVGLTEADAAEIEQRYREVRTAKELALARGGDLHTTKSQGGIRQFNHHHRDARYAGTDIFKEVG